MEAFHEQGGVPEGTVDELRMEERPHETTAAIPLKGKKQAPSGSS